MYQQFYGLRELPFELTPNPKYLFLPPQHREALSNLQYGLSSAKAMTVLVGEAGTGKTTLLQAALESEPCRNVSCVYLNNPTLTRREFVEILSDRFSLGPRAGESKAVLLGELDGVLRERRARGQITALVIDEAQGLSGELLEEIRLLANIETLTEKLLPLVLAGQPELRDRLNEPGLRQLKQRVTLRCEIKGFGLEETGAYIAWRIRTAGGDAAKLFTREAVRLIHQKSGGIPRVINVICDNALVTGFGLERPLVDRAMVVEVARDFDLGGEEPLDGGGTERVTERATERGQERVTERGAERGDAVPRPDDASGYPAVVAANSQATPNGRAGNERELFATIEAGRRRFSLFRGW